MKNFFWVLILFLAILTTGCGGDKPAILFNKNPITRETITDNTSLFSPGNRIYYVVLMPKVQKSRYLYVQVIKKDNEYERFGYDLIWSDTVRLKDEQMYYYDDYLVINQPGAYIMRVYSKDNPSKILCTAQFFVKN